MEQKEKVVESYYVDNSYNTYKFISSANMLHFLYFSLLDKRVFKNLN